MSGTAGKTFTGDGFTLEVHHPNTPIEMWRVETSTSSMFLTKVQLREILLAFCAYNMLGDFNS